MPAACRIGHADVPHCSGMTRDEGTETVLVNNIPWSCKNHKNTPHLKPCPPPPPCCIHTQVISLGSTTVFVETRGAGRVYQDVGGGDCTSVAEGSPNVFAGG